MTFARARALVLVAGLTLLALVFVVIAIVRDTQAVDTAQGCPKGFLRADLALREAKDIKINVYNGTDDPGLAKNVGTDFANRDFQVLSKANDPLHKAVDGVAVLRYGPKGVGSAQYLRAYFLDRAKPEYDPKRKDDVVDVVIGSAFTQLATTTEVNQALVELGQPEPPPGTCPADQAK